MTPPHRSPTRSVLPIMDETGTISLHPNLLDSRVPMGFLLCTPPRVLAARDRDDKCPDEWHLWDAILATGELIPADLEGDEVQPFRLRLTCTRCGLVRELSGLVDQSLYRTSLRLIPTPMTAGDLVALEIRRDSSGDRPLSTWAVHPRAAGPPIGAIGWSRGLRGRLFHVGRLYDRPGRYFEGRSPLSCLQQMARAVSDRAGAAV